MDEEILMDASATVVRCFLGGRFYPFLPRLAGWIPVFCLLACGVVSAASLDGLLQPGHPGWQVKEFSGRTVYTPDEGMLLAESNGTASGLWHEERIDLRATPYLCWSWKVAGVLDGVNEREKQGDDYPARVYVVVRGGLAFWQTRALSYVWASREPQGSLWSSAFTSHAAMIAVESGPDRAGELRAEKRDIRADWKAAFGTDIEAVDAVAIMTDTDNSGQRARAWYGRIWFAAQ